MACYRDVYPHQADFVRTYIRDDPVFPHMKSAHHQTHAVAPETINVSTQCAECPYGARVLKKARSNESKAQ